MKFRVNRILLTFLAAASITVPAVQAQESFDVESAIAVEGLFRGAAQRCGTPEFAQRFVSLSKTLVAFSLQGDGPIDTDRIEAAITRYAQDPRIQDLEKMCVGTLPKLEALYKNRLVTLQESQRAADALRGLDRSNSIP